MPARIFYSYAREDAVFLTQLRKHTSLLVRKGTIAEWVDTGENAGIDWRKAIDREINRADIVVLLVSADYFASDYGQYEMERAIALSKRIVPILIRPCLWKDAPFEEFNVLPSNAEPVSLWVNHEQAYLDVVEGLRAVVNEALVGAPHPSSVRTEQRILDAGLPSEVPFGERRSLFLMIRRQDSQGLVDYVQRELADRSVSPQDIVRSSPFPFEIGPAPSAKMRVGIQAPTLDFLDTEKPIIVPAHADSAVFSFLFRANEIGDHTVNVELVSSDAALVSRTLHTVTKFHGGPDDGGGGSAAISPDPGSIIITGVRLIVTCVAKAMHARAAGA